MRNVTQNNFDLTDKSVVKKNQVRWNFLVSSIIVLRHTLFFYYNVKIADLIVSDNTKYSNKIANTKINIHELCNKVQDKGN